MIIAGTGIRDISPRKPAFLVGYPHKERTSTGIHDPLLASALYLQNEKTGIIIIAIDILQIDPQTARKLRRTISDQAHIPESHVFISCTHTHSGPVTIEMIAWKDDPVVPKPDDEYMRYFEDRVIDSAIEALNNKRPAEIACTIAHVEGVGGNRLSPDGISDPEIGIILVRDLAKKKIFAISIIYSMHPTVLHEDSTLVSADFPGYMRTHIHENLGDDVTILYHTGPSGNQSPRYSVRSQTFEEAGRLGRILGEAVTTAITGIRSEDFWQDAVLDGRIESISLPARQMPTISEAKEALKQRIADYERLKIEKANRSAIRTAECAVFGAEETLTLARCQENGELEQKIRAYMPADVQVLRVGDCFLAGLPGEIFVEYGLQIKSQSSSKAFVISLVNGDLQGYIATPEAVAAGSYEANNSLFDITSGSIVTDAALKLIN